MIPADNIKTHHKPGFYKPVSTSFFKCVLKTKYDLYIPSTNKLIKMHINETNKKKIYKCINDNLIHAQSCTYLHKSSTIKMCRHSGL